VVVVVFAVSVSAPVAAEVVTAVPGPMAAAVPVCEEGAP